MSLSALRIGGLTALTSIDYPGELAAVVFCQGCPWRCRYCHNSHLLAKRGANQIPGSQVRAFLESRRGLLDAVVFSGGEPSLQRGLAGAMAEVKALGFKVGLHTAGCFPDRLRPLIADLDWVGLDIKGLEEDYGSITGVPDSGRRAWECLEVLLESDVALEVRTTLLPHWSFERHLTPLAERLAALGVRHYVLQACNTTLSLDPQLRQPPYPWALTPAQRAELAARFSHFSER